jgi:SAM-dependent methyltransferase
VLGLGLDYVAYDIDPDLIAYASRRTPSGRFMSTLDDVRAVGPFDLVIANCCFHHIADGDAKDVIGTIRHLLGSPGLFVLIDLLLEDRYETLARRLYNHLERGAYVRRREDYKRLVETQFKVLREGGFRSHMFSLKGNPVFYDLVVLECATTPAG